MALIQAQRRGQHLPAEVTSLVGREAELAQLGSLLERARLTTVTGTGGVGKTRLALRAAAQAVSRYPDGVVFADLAPAGRGRGRTATLGTVASALGLSPDAIDGQEQLAAILGYLGDRRLLLVLDTCEHVVDACARLAGGLLRSAPGVSVLATSREPLDVPGEHILSLYPLPVAGPRPPGSAGSLPDAVELFAQRAVSVFPGFILSDEVRPDVIALCQRLDGIPLALELAALRLRALPLAELGRLARRDDVSSRKLTGTRRTAMPRHQSLELSVEWSRNLCTPAERAVWARLSAFAGSFELASAEAVCMDAGMAPHEVTEAVIGLVDKSVLLREQPGEVATRYRLPHVFREPGADDLAADHAAEAAVRARYVAHWLRAAERFTAHLLDDQRGQYQALRREHANLRGALEYALALPDPEIAARLGCALSMYWIISGELAEGSRWLEQVAGHCREQASPRARALAARALLIATAGDFPAALADAEASVALADKAGDPVGRARGYIALHRVASWTGDLAKSAQLAGLAVADLQATGDLLGLAQVDIQSSVARLPTAPHECAASAARGLDRLPPGELWASSYLRRLIALARIRTAQYEAALGPARQALAMSHQLGDGTGIGYGLEILGIVMGAQRQHRRAAWLLGAASSHWERAGTRSAGHPVLEELHQKTARTALSSLGHETYVVLRDAGAARPLDEVIALVAEAPSGAPMAVGQVHGGARPPAEAGHRSATGPLTSREAEIATLVASGLSNREIAQHLGVSKRTVDAHVGHIFAKLSISSRVQLTLWLRDRVVF
jgi:predicted ATPase/DNA-binding CsgD family transcriptional regulator